MHAVSLLLLSWLLPLHFDVNRTFGDVAALQLRECQIKVVHLYVLQKGKVEEMQHRLETAPNPAPKDLDEFAKEQELLRTMRATIDTVHSAGDYLSSWGYRALPPPLPPEKPVADRPI